jgi:hypothetical protein
VPELVGGGGGGRLGEREMEEERESGRENENTERLYRMKNMRNSYLKKERGIDPYQKVERNLTCKSTYRKDF